MAGRRSVKLLGAGVAIGIGSTVLALLLAEAFVRAAVPVRLVGPALSEFDSVYGVRNKANFNGTQTTPEFSWHITTNALGFRGNDLESLNGGGILYLGDSHTVGYGVNDGEEFPALSSAFLAGTRFGGAPVINAGRGNTGQGHWLKFIDREAGRFSPIAVVFQVGENDFGDNVREAAFRREPDGSLAELPLAAPPVGRKVQHVMRWLPFLANSYLFGLVRQAYHSISSPGGPVTAQADSSRRAAQDTITYALLAEAARRVAQRGWPAVALLIGVPAERDSAIRTIFSSHHVPSASIPPKESRPDLYYPIDGHMNAAGHREAARAVTRLLQKLPAIPRETTGSVAPEALQVPH